jgi:hypothetical protein
MDKTLELIISFSYQFFNVNPVNSEKINEFIDLMSNAYKDYPINKEKLFKVLETKHLITISDDLRIIKDDKNHIEWFNEITSQVKDRDLVWSLWNDYKLYLSEKLPKGVLDKLDDFSNRILSMIEDPFRDGSWACKGMVVGQVQSGKTSSYTALVNKATDAGYKLIIVLAGIHDNLRSQTQERMNREFLGYDRQVIIEAGDPPKLGVGKYKNHKIVNTLTSSAQKGDFNQKIADQVGLIPSSSGDPIILIIKKHHRIIQNCINWLTQLIGHFDQDGKKFIFDPALLLIDDECDQASVNTKKVEYDESGVVVSDPTKTNEMIRKLLSTFKKSSYVGYTATPYANIFISGGDNNDVLGKDLFPRDFLINLPKPDNYVGPEELFGLEKNEETGIENRPPLPLVKDVEDSDNLIPGNHKKDLKIPLLPESLKNSIKCFILVCSARRIRSLGVEHNSMLIHVTRFNDVQSGINELLISELRSLAGRINNSTDPLDDFRKIWIEEFSVTSEIMMELGFKDSQIHDWEDVLKEMPSAIEQIKIRVINGKAKDMLDYREAEQTTNRRIKNGETVPWSERGTSLIVIGGDKLSRGLTLEGLSVSYYLRASRMYDTLMQMGRWFGYKDGYIDLCRIFTTYDLTEWYRHIALANKQLSNEFDYMAMTGGTPENFGLKVLNHPGRLAVTAAGKMRSTEKIRISFSGRSMETIVFNPLHSNKNLNSLKKLINATGRDPDNGVSKNNSRYHWKNISSNLVINFLNEYQTQDVAKRVVAPEKIAEFIEKQNKLDELTDWHVVLISNKTKDRVHSVKINNLNIGSIKRTPLRKIQPDKISIGVLSNPTDHVLDFSEKELAEIEEKYDKLPTKKGGTRKIVERATFFRQHRPVQRGLLLLYITANRDTKSKKDGTTSPYGLEGNEVVGFCISFPASEKAKDLEYVVNPVYLDEE